LKEFLSLLRRLLLLSAGAKGDAETERNGSSLSHGMAYENLLRAVSLAIEAEALARRAETRGSSSRCLFCG